MGNEVEENSSDSFSEGLSLEVHPRPSLGIWWSTWRLYRKQTRTVHPVLSEKSFRNINTMWKWVSTSDSPWCTGCQKLCLSQKRSQTECNLLELQHSRLDPSPGDQSNKSALIKWGEIKQNYLTRHVDRALVLAAIVHIKELNMELSLFFTGRSSELPDNEHDCTP